MVEPPGPPSSASPPERRRDRRVAFPLLLRPQLRTPFATHAVVNASLSGVLVAYAAMATPREGQVIHGSLEWPHGQAALNFTGTVVRVQGREVALRFERGLIPMGYLP